MFALIMELQLDVGVFPIFTLNNATLTIVEEKTCSLILFVTFVKQILSEIWN